MWNKGVAAAVVEDDESEGVHGWGFNAERFAKIYVTKRRVDKEKMMWGDTVVDPKKKTRINVQLPEGCTEARPRAFCQFIVTPIQHERRIGGPWDHLDGRRQDLDGQVLDEAYDADPDQRREHVAPHGRDRRRGSGVRAPTYGCSQDFELIDCKLAVQTTAKEAMPGKMTAGNSSYELVEGGRQRGPGHSVEGRRAGGRGSREPRPRGGVRTTRLRAPSSGIVRSRWA